MLLAPGSPRECDSALDKIESALFIDDALEAGTRSKSGATVNIGDFEQSQVSTMMYSLLGVVVYFAVGFVYGLTKGWSVCDTLYFVVVTVTTVGYGDFAFPTQADKVFGMFFVFFGVAIVGLCLIDLLAGVAHIALREAKPDDDSWHFDADTLDASKAHVKEDMEASFHKRKMSWFREARKYIIAMVAVIGIGAISMWLAEKDGKHHWTLVDAFYFCMVTATTVGYGDIVPTTNVGKILTVVFICFSFYIVANAISFMVALPAQIKQKQHKYQVLLQFGESLQTKELTSLINGPVIKFIRDTNPTRRGSKEENITRAEFIIWMCVKLGKLDKNDVTRAMNIFDSLDKDKSGSLDYNDITAEDLVIPQVL
jgi:potassium channel subfamily K